LRESRAFPLLNQRLVCRSRRKRSDRFKVAGHRSLLRAVEFHFLAARRRLVRIPKALKNRFLLNARLNLFVFRRIAAIVGLMRNRERKLYWVGL